MSTFSFTPQQLSRRLKQDAKKLPDAVRRGLRMGAARGRTRLVRATPTDLGQMKNAWKDSATVDGAKIVNDAPHAGIIERGARPHKVSEEGMRALMEWVVRNLGTEIDSRARQRQAYGPRIKGARGGRRALGAYRVDVAEEIAQAIARKIRAQGQEPKLIVAKRMDDLARDARLEVERQILKYANKGNP